MKNVVSLLMVSMSIASNVGGQGTGFLEAEPDNLRPLIEEFESIKLVAYRCPSGVVTIGMGSTRYDDGRRVKMGDKISLDYAEVLYEKEVEKVREQIDEVVISDLNKNQEDISNLCSSFKTEGDRFNSGDWDLSGTPFLKSAQANIFCTVDQLISYHTHTIVIGHVTNSFSDEKINTLTYVCLLYTSDAADE